MGLQVATGLWGVRFRAINLPKYTDLCSVDNVWELTTFHNRDTPDTEKQASLFFLSPVLNHTLHRLKRKVKMIKLGRRKIPDSSRKTK